jgi:hypothetical protein
MRLPATCLLLALATGAAAGRERAACLPSIEGGWVRMAPGMPMGVAFGVIRNACDAPVEVTGVSSPQFADVGLHETRIERGISRMRPVPLLPVRAGGAVGLRPGGLHVMLMAPRGPVARTIRVDFQLRDGRRIRADLPVRAAAP